MEDQGLTLEESIFDHLSHLACILPGGGGGLGDDLLLLQPNGDLLSIKLGRFLQLGGNR